MKKTKSNETKIKKFDIFSVFNFFDDSISIGPIGEYKSKEIDAFFKKCVDDVDIYKSLVEGRLGGIPFKTYVNNGYMYVVTDNDIVGLYLDNEKENRNIRIYKNDDDVFYDYSRHIYSDEVSLKQVCDNDKKICESISTFSNRASRGFIGLIGMNIPNQYFSNECRMVINSEQLYKSRMLYEKMIDGQKIVVSKNSYWTSIDKFINKEKASIIELDLVMPTKFQKSLYVKNDSDSYYDLYNSSGLSLSYEDVCKLLSQYDINIDGSDNFISLINTQVIIPEKLDKLCNIVNVAKLAYDLDVEVGFSTIGED